MTGTVMDFSHRKRAAQRTLGLDSDTRSAVADLARERWPSNTAKLAAREWRLTLDEARGVVAGRTSLTTYDKIKKAGGWPVIFAVEARVIGQGADQYLIELRGAHEHNASRLAALVGDPWPWAGARDPDPTLSDHTLDERRRSVASREG